MKADSIAWLVIAWCAALGVSVSAAAHCSPRLNVSGVVRDFGSRKEATVDPLELEGAISTVTQSREWAAFLLTIGIHESGLRERIARQQCRAHECDHGLAWGLFQVHRTEANSPVWGSPELLDQATEASRLARAAFYRCKDSGVDFPLGAFRAYAGRNCVQPFPGEAQRVATYRSVLNRL